MLVKLITDLEEQTKK